jgi:ChrR-like protein with cupin domain
MNRKRSLLLALIAVMALAALCAGQAAGGQKGSKKATKSAASATAAPAKKMAAETHKVITPDQLKWGAGPSALPPGAQLAVLEGNPMAAGPYTMRVKVPDGYKVQPHWHKTAEHVTVLSGTLHIGMGNKWDQAAATSMPSGSFVAMKAHATHYAWAEGETVFQLHGYGPWEITYVNPKDDPRNKK